MCVRENERERERVCVCLGQGREGGGEHVSTSEAQELLASEWMLAVAPALGVAVATAAVAVGSV